MPGHVCSRFRGFISLELDAELDELERATLEGHLVGCDSCRAYRSEVHALTRELRTAPLEPLERPIVRRRRRRLLRAQAVQVAAAAAVVLLAALTGLTRPSPPTRDVQHLRVRQTTVQRSALSPEEELELAHLAQRRPRNVA